MLDWFKHIYITMLAHIGLGPWELRMELLYLLTISQGISHQNSVSHTCPLEKCAVYPASDVTPGSGTARERLPRYSLLIQLVSCSVVEVGGRRPQEVQIGWSNK